MPTLQFKRVGRADQVNLYSDFVISMIESKNTRVPNSLNLGISVPSYYRQKDLKGLFEFYSKENAEPTFVSVDFKQSSIEDKKRMKVVKSLTEHYAAEGTEDYFLYGLNLHSYTTGPTNPVSNDMLIARSGLNAVGEYHRRPGGKGGSKITQIEKLGAVFDPVDYRYHFLSEQDQKERFCSWAVDNGYSFDIDNKMSSHAYKIMPAVKKFNLVMENNEFFTVSYAIRKNDKDLLKGILDKGNDLSVAAVVTDSAQRTLDSF